MSRNRNTGGPTHVGDHAVVLGGGLAGLAAAGSLAERFDAVTIVERDALPLVGEHRNGVPQGRHAHLLLPGGLRALAQLFPGIVDDLESHGAHIIDAPEIRFYLAGGRLALSDPSLSACGATRSLLEGVIRRRLRGLPNVHVAERSLADGLVADPNGAQVTGVRLRSPTISNDDSIMDATLVVDATGRGSRTPRWLAAIGFPAPDEERIHVGVHYRTGLFRRDPADLGGCRHVLVAIPPGGRHNAAGAVQVGVAASAEAGWCRVEPR